MQSRLEKSRLSAFIGGRKTHIWICVLFFWFATLCGVFAKPVLNVEDPVGFFSTLADKALRNTFSFGLTNIPVYSNGVFVYTPSIQRLLQISANVFEASTTNFYPTVFRPVLEQNGFGNVYIVGYTNLSSDSVFNTVSDAGDPQLSQPHDIGDLLNFPPNAPIADANGLVNVYDVPWIIGAKKGFPNFNAFSMQNVVQVFRKLQVTRQTTSSYPNATNQMYVFSLTNSLGVEFWNSYTNSYSNQVQLVVNDKLFIQMLASNVVTQDLIGPLLVDGQPIGSSFPVGPIITNLNIWPGMSFVIPFATNFPALMGSAYRFGQPGFSYLGNIPNPTYEATSPAFALLPQLLLDVTNRLQVFILDVDSDHIVHVIDYVHFTGPGTIRNLTAEFQNTNIITSGGTLGYYTNLIWSTAMDNAGLPLGVSTQIGIADGSIPLNTSLWRDPNADQEIDGFKHFLDPNYVSKYGSKVFYSTNLTVQAPYTPSATTYEYTTYQANDPLVHYLASDLEYFGYDPNGSSLLQTGVHMEPPYTLGFPVLPGLGKLNARYQPWGRNPPNGQAGASQATYDESPFNLSFKDPLVEQSDGWDFPKGGGLPLTTLGRIHRGTPWQTVYMKAYDILAESNPQNPNLGNVGTNTWAVWTGNSNIPDAVLTAPINDRRLVGWLVPLMNTNSPGRLLSENDTNLADWATVFGGFVVFTNSTPYPKFSQYQPLTNGLLVINPTNPVVALLVSAINTTRSNFESPDGSVSSFENIGDILCTPWLSEQSPFLNLNNSVAGGQQLQYGISDELYEAIPSQLLPLLRPDSFGKICQMNGKVFVEFTGSDGFDYALQNSTNLVCWKFVGTNCPVQGHFRVPSPSVPGTGQQFFRSKQLP